MLIAAGLVLAAVVSWLPRMQGPIDLRWDAGAYFVLGTSLAEGKGYRLLSEPGEIQTTLHPPMLPAIVALHELALRSNDWLVVGAWLRRFYFLLYVCLTLGAYALLRVFLPRSYAVPATVVCMFQLHTIFMSDLCFPEIPFALTTVAFTLCNLDRSSGRWRWLLLPLAAAAFALRTVGVALLAAWALEGVARRNFRQAAIRGVLAAILVGGWTSYIRHIESGPEYNTQAYEYQRADYVYTNVSYAKNLRYKDSFSPELGYASLSEQVGRVWQNLLVMPISLGEAVSARRPIWDLFLTEFQQRTRVPVFSRITVPLLLVGLAALIAWGLGILVMRGQYFIALYVLGSIAALCATPWPGQFNRYLSPLAPFLALSLFLALQCAGGLLRTWTLGRSKLIARAPVFAVALLLIACEGATLYLLYSQWQQTTVITRTDSDGRTERVTSKLFFYQPLNKSTDAGLDWLVGHAAPGDVVAVTDPQWAYLRTGLKTVIPPFEREAPEAQRLLDTVPVSYLMVDDSVYRKYTEPVVAKYTDLWRRVYPETANEPGPRPEGYVEIYKRVGASQAQTAHER